MITKLHCIDYLIDYPLRHEVINHYTTFITNNCASFSMVCINNTIASLQTACYLYRRHIVDTLFCNYFCNVSYTNNVLDLIFSIMIIQ